MIIRTRESPRWKGVSQSRNRSVVLKKTFPRTILFLGKDLFWGAKKRGSTGEVDVCCSFQPSKALEDPDV